MSIIIDDVKPTEEDYYIGYDFYLKDSSNEVKKYHIILEDRKLCCEHYNIEVIEGNVRELIGNELVSVSSKTDNKYNSETYNIKYCRSGDKKCEYKSVYIKMYNTNSYYAHEYKSFYYNQQKLKESSGEI